MNLNGIITTLNVKKMEVCIYVVRMVKNVLNVDFVNITRGDFLYEKDRNI